MPHPCFPLHWESTGNQWWYASPIDFAAANGHYDVVRKLLHIDINLLIKLTSLRRIQRLETLWDDYQFREATKCRSFVARNLLLECETKKNKNSLIRAGYGGWLIYTAASAGDIGFIHELLERDPLLVFGEGEYGVTDILYAAARSKNSQVFEAIFKVLASLKGLVGQLGGVHDGLGNRNDDVSLFKWEIVNRAVFAAARGGNLEVLKDLMGQNWNVLAYRDSEGATILHAASARGQVEVVNYLVVSHDLISSRDNRGNTALHVAAFWGHLKVVEALILVFSTLSSAKNIDGDTFLHMAVAGFQAPGFQRLDRPMELIRQLISGDFVNIQEIINVQNKIGRTALHVALIEIRNANLIDLLLAIPSVNINIQDIDGLTPFSLLPHHVRSASLDVISNSIDLRSRSANLKMQSCAGNSPGTSFRIPDSEIFLYAGIEALQSRGMTSSCSSAEKSELPHFVPLEQRGHHSNKKNLSKSDITTSRRLRILLAWPLRMEKMTCVDRHDTIDSTIKWNAQKKIPMPLRQRQTSSMGTSSLLNNKRVIALRTSMLSPSMRKKFGAYLVPEDSYGRPWLKASSQSQTPSSPFSSSQLRSLISERHKAECVHYDKCGSNGGSSFIKSGFKSAKHFNKYFCFRAEGVAVDGSSGNQFDGRSVPPV